MSVPIAIQATEQEGGSMKVEYEDRSIRFVPPTESNKEFEALHVQVMDTEFRVGNATEKCMLRPEDVADREARRSQE